MNIHRKVTTAYLLCDKASLRQEYQILEKEQSYFCQKTATLTFK